MCRTLYDVDWGRARPWLGARNTRCVKSLVGASSLTRMTPRRPLVLVDNRVANSCAPDDAHQDTKRERVDKTAASKLSHRLEAW